MDAADQIKALGDLEYESDMSEYLDPIARYGFDVDIWRSTKRGSHFDPFKDTINIQPTHTGSKGVQAHEYRHRAFNKMFREYRKNPEFYEEKYPGVGDLLKSMIIRKDDEDLNERITEFYDKPEMFNLSPQYFTPDRVLHKGRHYKEDPYEYSNVEHDGMPVYGTAFDVRRYLPKGSVEDTLDFGDEAGLEKRREFNEYRDQTDGNRDGNVFFDNVLRLEQMAKDLYKEERGFSQGGEVMQGIGTLNETARNMTRGPRGIGAYQQFASGGEAMGPPPTRGPDPQGIGYFQQFADGGPVYMQEGGPPSAGEIKSEILDAVYEAESNSNYDQWHLNAKNIPEKPLTEMTVEEIMRYQGDNKGPAAGAGQIKFDTLQYLIDYGTIQPTDVFNVETQDKAHSRLLDRRGFQSWVSGEMSNTDFGQNVAKEYAGIPLLADEEVNGVLRPRGSSRYGGSNVARIGLDDWEGLLATAKTATPDYGTVAAVNSEAKSPFIETLTMRGEDVAMSMPVEQSERMSELGQENLADGRYFQGTKPEDVMTPSVGELLSSKYSRPRTQEAAEAKQRAMDRSKQTSLYEQFAPEGVQDLFSGIGSYIRGEEPQQEEEVNVYGSPPAKPPETFRKFLKPNSTIL